MTRYASPGATDRDDDERLSIIQMSGRISAKNGSDAVNAGGFVSGPALIGFDRATVGDRLPDVFSSADATHVSVARRAAVSAARQTLPAGGFDQKQSGPYAGSAPRGYERSLGATRLEA
jgi:hypothetical protein